MIALLLQSTTAPLPMPQTYGEGFLIFVLLAVGGAFYRAQEARIRRESEVSDLLRAERKTDQVVIADLTVAVRELHAYVRVRQEQAP